MKRFGLIGTAVLVTVVFVATGCADTRPTAGPELGQNERPGAAELVSSLLDLRPLLTTTYQEATSDECGLVGDRPLGGSGSDPRPYTCSTLEAHSYPGPAIGAESAWAVDLDVILTERGCSSESPLPQLIPSAPLNGLDSDPTIAQYDCGDSVLLVGIASPKAAALNFLLDQVQLVASGTGTQVSGSSRLTLSSIPTGDEQSYIVAISAQTIYLNVLTCGDLHLCES